jgi:hypothetical protein
MVKIKFFKDEAIIISALAAKISQTPFEEGDIETLYKECKLDQKKSKELVNRIMINSGHLVLGDFLPYAITLEDISRMAAVYIWRNVNTRNLVFGAGIEASFRVIKPNRYNEISREIGERALKSYDKAVSLGVLEQDARYLLPEGTLTRMIFSAPPRHLLKIANCLKDTILPELKEIGTKIEKIVLREFGFENPGESLPSKWSFWGEEKISEKISLSCQKNNSIALEMGIKGSLSMYAQLVRQRQLLCEMEPLESIAKNSEFVLPSTFPENIRQDYKEIAEIARSKQAELIQKRDPSFVYFLLLGQQAFSMIYGNGPSILETSKSRSEGVAQWEIRNKVGIPLTRELLRQNESFKKIIGPRCWREGRCVEPKTFRETKNVCRAFLKDKGHWQGNLEELLKTLEEPCQTFKI